MLLHDLPIDIPPPEDATMNLRMQGLYPAIHHFRETGVVGHFHGIDALLAQQLEGAAGGKDLDALGAEFAGEIDNAGLVGHADQRATYGQAGGLVGHLHSRSDKGYWQLRIWSRKPAAG